MHAAPAVRDLQNIDHRAAFSKWWVAEFKAVAFPPEVRALEAPPPPFPPGGGL